MRRIIQIQLVSMFILAFGLLFSGCQSGKTTSDKEKPNVLLVVVDDVGYGQLSCYPQTKTWNTPNLDRLADEGVRFTQAYSAHPMCWPSRASILTGRYYERFLKGFIVPKSEKMVSQYFKEQGYATGLVGKWHNCTEHSGTDGEKQQNHPMKWGFDEFDGFLTGAHDYYNDTLGWHTSQVYAPIFHGYEEVEEDVPYLTTYFTNKSKAFISRHKDHPFFLMLTYTAVHSPKQAPEALIEKNNGDVEAAMLEALDNGMGEIMSSLEDLGLDEHTMVLFAGDNGGYMKNSNWKLRGKKSLAYEGGIRIPFILKYPQKIEGGTVYDSPVMHIDVLPTLLDAIGAEPDEAYPVDGKNLVPYITGEQEGIPHKTLFWEFRNYKRFAIRDGNWKLVNDNEDRKAEPVMGLYNLAEDVGETNNLIEEKPQKKEELLNLFENWKQTMRSERRSINQMEGQ